MKTASKFLLRFLLAFAFSAALGLTSVQAHDGSDDNEQGGEIEGTETVNVDLTMTPTASAPAGASIQLSFEADDEQGVTEAELKLQTQSLPPGTYSVSVTLKSDGSTVALGTFTVDAEGEGEIEFKTAQTATESGDDGDDNGEEEAAFPAGFNPLDIATVTVSDANGTPLFTADLTSATANTNINATVTASAGAAAPTATGTATLNAFTRKGQVKGSLQMLGQSLPTKFPVTLSINGVAAKNLKTDKRGGVTVKLGPKGDGTVAPGVNLMNVHTVTLRDQSGNTLLQANF